MINWFHFNKYPKFWKNYQSKFNTPQPKSIEETRFVAFDTETTGLDASRDKILSIGAVSIIKNTIDISDNFEIYLRQQTFNASTVEIHGILKEGKLIKLNEEEGIEKFINYIGNSVLIAHHAAFDIAIINAALKRLKLPKLKNKIVDTGTLFKKMKDKKDKHYTLDYLCNSFNISKHDRHTAAGDAYITALLFLKILSKIKQERNLPYSDLFRKGKKGLI